MTTFSFNEFRALTYQRAKEFGLALILFNSATYLFSLINRVLIRHLSLRCRARGPAIAEGPRVSSRLHWML